VVRLSPLSLPLSASCLWPQASRWSAPSIWREARGVSSTPIWGFCRASGSLRLTGDWCRASRRPYTPGGEAGPEEIDYYCTRTFVNCFVLGTVQMCQTLTKVLVTRTLGSTVSLLVCNPKPANDPCCQTFFARTVLQSMPTRLST
jgi:hypothetical protein